MVKKSSLYSLCVNERELRDIGVLTNISLLLEGLLDKEKPPRDAAWDSAVPSAIMPVWRNGRRDKLKPCFSSGSSPETGTILDTNSNFYIFFGVIKIDVCV